MLAIKKKECYYLDLLEYWSFEEVSELLDDFIEKITPREHKLYLSWHEDNEIAIRCLDFTLALQEYESENEVSDELFELYMICKGHKDELLFLEF